MTLSFLKTKKWLNENLYLKEVKKVTKLKIVTLFFMVSPAGIEPATKS